MSMYSNSRERMLLVKGFFVPQNNEELKALNLNTHLDSHTNDHLYNMKETLIFWAED